MSSSTPNLNLVLPVGGEHVSRAIINENNTKIDTFAGIANSSLNTLSEQIVPSMLDVQNKSYTSGSIDDLPCGIYRIYNSVTQIPASSAAGYCSCYLRENGTKLQVYTSDTNRTFTRTKVSGTWSNWEELALKSKIEDRTGTFHCEGIGVGITASRCDVFFPITGLKTNGTVSITSLGVTNLWTGSQGKDHASVIVIYNTGIVVRLTDSNANPFTAKNAYYCSADITVS